MNHQEAYRHVRESIREKLRWVPNRDSVKISEHPDRLILSYGRNKSGYLFEFLPTRTYTKDEAQRMIRTVVDWASSLEE